MSFKRNWILLVIATIMSIAIVFVIVLAGRTVGRLVNTTTETPHLIDPQVKAAEPYPTVIPTPEPSTIETLRSTPTPLECTDYLPPELDIPLGFELKSYIYDECGWDEELYCFVMSVMKSESEFELYAVSADGHDKGLMQLRDTYYDAWKEEYNVYNPAEPYDNVTVGVSLLRKYLEKYEHKNLALMCYNIGETGAKRLWQKGIYNTNYTMKVMNTYGEYLAEVKE